MKIFYVLELMTNGSSATAISYGCWIDELQAYRYKQDLEIKHKPEYGKTVVWKVMSHDVIGFDEDVLVERAAEMAGILDRLKEEENEERKG